jgi:hypothetical protein
MIKAILNNIDPKCEESDYGEFSDSDLEYEDDEPV